MDGMHLHNPIYGVNIMETILKTKISGHLKVAIILVVTIIALTVFARQGHTLQWTGLGKSMMDAVQQKTLWDWVDLLLFPLLVALAIFLWTSFQREAERQRADLQRSISTDDQQEKALQSYIDRMTDLLLKEKLSKFSPEEVRQVARVRTLSVLRGLDARRKGMTILFLKDSGLIDREAIVDLCGADLREVSLPYARLGRVNLGEANLSKAFLCAANLSKAYLSEVNLTGADLSWANLSGADLYGANLSGADLSQANLKGANLNGSNLTGCCLSGADLSQADLSGVKLNIGDLAGANLTGAKLGGAELVGADLSEADLSQADLSGAQVTKTNLDQAKSLDGTILPDGSKPE